MEQSYVAEDILMVGANTCTCALYLMKVFLDIFLNIHVQYPDLSFLLWLKSIIFVLDYYV